MKKEIIKEEVKSVIEIKRESLVKEELRLTDDSDVVEVVEEVMKEDLLAKYDQWDIDDDAEIARRTAHKLETARLRGLLDNK